MTPVIIEFPAKLDMADAVSYYRTVQPGLEADFRLCVRAAMNRISRYPESYAVVERQLRRALVERFPFAVFYRYEPGVVRVFAVLHTSRHPRIWQARTH